jgi:RimJ/RimL family protein N-acetyltransferase
MNGKFEIADIYSADYIRHSVSFLYELLAEREPEASISHRKMPSFEEHAKFVESKPYKAWYVVMVDGIPIGSVYLTHKNEIGIFIKKYYQGQHYGKAAIRALILKHPEKEYLANIAPGNARSISLFEKLGFDLIQLTMRKDQ